MFALLYFSNIVWIITLLLNYNSKINFKKISLGRKQLNYVFKGKKKKDPCIHIFNLLYSRKLNTSLSRQEVLPLSTLSTIHCLSNWELWLRVSLTWCRAWIALSQQNFSALTLLTFWFREVFVVRGGMPFKKFSSFSGLHPLDANTKCF